MKASYINLTELLAANAEKYPGRTAIKDSNSSFTYLQLYQHAAFVAENLVKYQVRPGDRVVCISKKDAASIISFWGILLCGGIPVMLDHEDGMPSNAVKIIEVAAVAIILDNKEQALPYGFPSNTILTFTDIMPARPGFSISGKAGRSFFQDICYILLTSGTTGNQKAVQITHANVLHYTNAIYEKIGRPDQVNAVHASTFAADLGLTNLLVALISGGMLRILSKTESTDPALFTEIIDRDEISLLKITPSHLISLISDMQKPLRVPITNIILGGEKLSWEFARNIFSLGICKNLYNHYGPTEATIGALAFKIEPSYEYFGKTGSVPLGTPIGEGRCFVGDMQQNTGELFIAGPGVSIGYLNNDTENKNKFIVKEIYGTKLGCYRTGDICKKLDDGNYEFLYRTDRQVKVLGYRMELGEIEMAIAAHSGVENVMVAVSELQGRNVLVAYIKTHQEFVFNKEMMRSWLRNRLPEHKIPANIYFYSKAPYNSNGKIDFNALKKSFATDPPALTREIDKLVEGSWPLLADVSWKKILNKAEISADDNFFETGGDSLLAIQLIGRLQRYGYKVYITDLNNHPVFSDFIRVQPPKSINNDEKAPGKLNHDKFTFAQRQFLAQRKLHLNSYCQAILLESENKISVREMALAINHILQGHPQLTTAFRKKNDHYIKEKKNWRGSELRASILDNKISVIAQIQEIAGNLLGEISAEKGKLFIAHVFIDPAGKDYLYLACHHLVIDVISWNIIIDELIDFYDQLLTGEQPVVTPENTVNIFLDKLAQKKIEQDLTGEINTQKVYRLPIMELNNNITGPEVYQVAIPPEISAILRKLEDQHATYTVNGILLSVLGSVLLHEFGLPEITVDVEYHGRSRHDELPDLSRSVSWWSTTVPINLKQGMLSAQHCSGLVEGKAAVANSSYMHNVQFPETTGERPDIIFNYLGRFPDQFENKSIRLKPSHFNPGQTRSKEAFLSYKMFFTARFVGKNLIIDIQYQPGLFSGTTAENISRAVVNAMYDSLKNGNQHFNYSGIALLKSNIPSVGQPLYNLGTNNLFGKVYREKTILLTGATGFLGSHLLQELTRSGEAKVYCLVRGENQAHAEKRIEHCLQYYFGDLSKVIRSKIKVVKGDILSDNFGIEKADYTRIAGDIDLIVHAAADTNLMKNYEELMHVNITATKKIIELAMTGKKKELHYISTLAVSGCSPGGKTREFSEEDFDYGQTFISDYENTKFEAEKMIRHFLQHGGEGKIYRVGHIAADSVSGKFQRNIEQNRIFQMLKGIILLRAIPETLFDRISFSYVDIVAAAITNFCLGRLHDTAQCYHLENPHSLSFIEIGEMLQHMGYDIAVAETDMFMKQVAGFDGTQSDKKFVELMAGWAQRSIDFPRRVKYLQRNSLDTIARSGLYFPKTTIKWVANMIHEAEKVGFLDGAGVHKSTTSLVVDGEIA